MTTCILPQAMNWCAFLAGVALHWNIFRTGEWHLYKLRILCLIVMFDLAASLILTLLALENITSTWEANRMVSSLLVSCAIGIFSSILLHRVAFHRLNGFAGPSLARVSNLYITALFLRRFQLHKEIRSLHKIYGPIVRVGPSLLSIADPDALALIHSTSSNCTKAPFYDMFDPNYSLLMTRDQRGHTQRRKAWDKGLSSSKALHNYEPRVRRYTAALLETIRSSQEKHISLDMSLWVRFYSFDVMGDLAFGKSFNMLQGGKRHYCMESVRKGQVAISTFSHLSWVFNLLKSVPVLNDELIRTKRWVAEQVRQRREMIPESPDLFSWLLEDFNAKVKRTSTDSFRLEGDAHLIVVAGSDTTAATITCLLFELANNPGVASMLSAELDGYFSEHDEPDDDSLSKLEYLQSCISEALRLYPAVPSGLQRLTPPEGLKLGNTTIPGHTVVQIPTYTLQRDEQAFPQPDDFIPERWTSRPELIKNRSAFAPFSIGRYACAGKQLAMMEIRSVISQIFYKYHVRMAPGQTFSDFWNGLQDIFTLATPCLRLEFLIRHPASQGEGKE